LRIGEILVDTEFEYDSVFNDDNEVEYSGEAANDLEISIEVSKRELRMMVADAGGPAVVYGEE